MKVVFQTIGRRTVQGGHVDSEKEARELFLKLKDRSELFIHNLKFGKIYDDKNKLLKIICHNGNLWNPKDYKKRFNTIT